MCATTRPWLNDALKQLALGEEQDRKRKEEKERKLKLAYEHARRQAAVERMKITGSVEAKAERRRWRETVKAARKKALEDKKREVTCASGPAACVAVRWEPMTEATCASNRSRRRNVPRKRQQRKRRRSDDRKKKRSAFATEWCRRRNNGRDGVPHERSCAPNPEAA